MVDINFFKIKKIQNPNKLARSQRAQKTSGASEKTSSTIKFASLKATHYTTCSKDEWCK